MTRQYAPLHTEIWNDREFVALSAHAQRLYLLAISQPNITWAGTVPYTARRWATLASDTTAKTISRAAVELAKAGLVMLDENTEEMWVRSFIKYNAAAQPKLRNAALREFRGVHSEEIRRSAVAAYPWLRPEGAHSDAQANGHPDAHSEISPELRVGVGVQCQVQEKALIENTNTNTELQTWLRAEAERQADAWLARDPKSIVDRAGWVTKRTKTLAGEYSEIPSHAKRSTRLACVNPNCRRGSDVAGSEPVPCPYCTGAAPLLVVGS